MRKQLHEWRVLVDCIIEKVWEYIDELELEYWGDDATLWVEAESATVNLGEGDQKFPGEGRPASLFVRTNEDGSKEPDGDYIEDYASQWFDFRTGD